MTYQSATLNLTPWAHEALGMDEMADLGKRAVGMHARVTVIKGRQGWTIRVTSWAEDEHHDPIRRIDRHHERGHLADRIHLALDAYERAYIFTPDELAQIQSQTGRAA